MGTWFGISHIKNHEELWRDANDDAYSSWGFVREADNGRRQELSGPTQALILMLPTTGLERITEENAEEVFIRIRMLELAGGDGILKDENGKSTFVSLRHILRHVGLESPPWNESPYPSELVRRLRDRATKALQAEQESTR